MSDKKILVADDSSTVRTIVCDILQNAGYDVVVAVDGASAIKQAQAHNPNLAILDIVMPEMDGYAVCEMLQSLGGPLAEMPIVFLTSVKSQALQVLGSEYGAYMNKPVDPTLLLETIERQLARCF